MTAVTEVFDAPPVVWASTERKRLFDGWLNTVAPAHGLRVDTVRLASADASFRRYLRVTDTQGRTRIVMDAPPDKEDCRPFVDVAALLHGAGLNAPEVLNWHEADGFMLLSDLGGHTVMQHVQMRLGLDAQSPPLAKQTCPGGELGASFAQLYTGAIDTLIPWQLASRPGALQPYDDANLQREMQLFPDWYIAQHKGVVLSDAQKSSLQGVFELIKARNLSAPKVFVHRDFMPRNLMMPTAPGQALGVLDFQDALYGPATYDIAALMRDAFLSWNDEFVLDVSVRYWERARKAGILTNGPWGDWGDDFGDFWRAVDYMALQRHLKIAGIFARLTLRDGKPRYLADAPRFIAYIRETAQRYRELKPLLNLVELLDGIHPDTAYLRKFGL